MELLTGHRLGAYHRLFWQPWLGSIFHLQPSDMSDVFIMDWIGMYNSMTVKAGR